MTNHPEDAVPLTASNSPPMKLNSNELRLYRQLIESVPSGHFTLADALALAQYCKLLGQLERAQQSADGQPFTTSTSQGLQVSAHWRAVDLMQRRAMAMQTALRLTPAARKRAAPTKLGAEREALVQGQRDLASAESTPRRSSLMFGGLQREDPPH